MLTINEFSKQINHLKSEKNYAPALAYFKENKLNFSKEQISENEYIVSNIISCLRYTNQLDAGFKFLEIFNININTEKRDKILTSYGWLLWSKFKEDNNSSDNHEEETHYFEDDDTVHEQNHHYEKNDIVKKIENIIIVLNKNNNEFNSLLISKLFTTVLKTEKRKQLPNWKFVNEFCDIVNPNFLSKETSTIKVPRKGQMKDLELASAFEEWYTYKSTALFKTSKWQECCEFSKEALDKIEIFHYNNDSWISRRIALSKKYLGNIDEAITDLEQILKKKKEWFIQKDLSELFIEINDFERAHIMAVNAINNFGPLEYKIDLLFVLGIILNKQGNSELAFKHFSLSKLLRLEKEWKVPQKLSDELSKFTENEISLSNKTELIKELKIYWNKFKNEKPNYNDTSKNCVICEGQIKNIMHSNEKGKDGFLKSIDKEYYFSLDNNNPLTKLIAVNSKVHFTISENHGTSSKKFAKIIEIIN